MLQRLERHDYYMGVARLTAQRASCMRGQVGAVLIQEGRIICCGYNGPLRGDAECNNKTCDLTQTCQRAIHAEANLLLFASRKGIPVEGCTLYSTTAPCYNCARAIIQAGIVKVVYEVPYKDEQGILLLSKHNVGVEQYTPTDAL